MIAEGIIKNIRKYEFSHSANAEKSSLGSPIFLKNSNKVIGIHKAGVGNMEKFGDFIYPVIKIIEEEEDIRKKEINVNISMENIYMMMAIIIQVILKIIYQMVKALNIIKMAIYYMKVILLMVNLMDMENILEKME